jgi:DNA-binding IscR family transcriptional regulator
LQLQPALARAEQTFAAALQRISLEDLVRWAERKALSNAAEPGAAKN